MSRRSERGESVLDYLGCLLTIAWLGGVCFLVYAAFHFITKYW